MKISVVQPSYFSGNHPDEKIASFIIQQMKDIAENSLAVFPEYSNAGGLTDKDKIINALPRAEELLKSASEIARKKRTYIAINVIQKRNAELKNSTYFFDKNGAVAFVYDKVHLPPSEIAMNIIHGNGACVCQVDGIKFGFMTCYDVYFNEQIEYIANYKPDVILIPGYQRGERTDIIRAQAKLVAFRCNAFVVRASFSMHDEEHGGCSMIVAPDGQIIMDMGKDIGVGTCDVNIFSKYMRTAGFGGNIMRNDDFISNGMCPEIFELVKAKNNM